MSRVRPVRTRPNRSALTSAGQPGLTRAPYRQDGDRCHRDPVTPHKHAGTAHPARATSSCCFLILQYNSIFYALITVLAHDVADSSAT